MYQCMYCGNRTDDKDKPCTSCKSTEFKKYEPEKPVVITRVPQGGYTLKINNTEYNNYQRTKYKKRFQSIATFIVISLVIFSIIIYLKTPSSLFPIILFIISISVIISIILLPKLSKKINERNNYKYNRLTNHGILVKKLPYKIIERDLPNHNYKMYFLEVKYEVNGNLLTFTSHPFFDNKFSNNKIDLLYDPDDTSIYYMDFNIY